MELQYSISEILSGLDSFLQTNNFNNKKHQLSHKIIELHAAKTRKITIHEMFMLEQQNSLLDQIKNTLNEKKNIQTQKQIEQTFETNQDIDTSISFFRTSRETSLLIRSQSNNKSFTATSPRGRIRRKSFTGIDLEAVYNCVRNNLGLDTCNILKGMITTNSSDSNSKYKLLYQKQKTAHQTTQLNRQQLAAKTQSMTSRVQQLENQVNKIQNQKKNISRMHLSLQSKQTKLTKLQTKLLIRQKILKQQQRHLQTMKSSVSKQKELTQKYSLLLNQTDSDDQAVKLLKANFEQMRKSLKQHQKRLQDQFDVLNQLVEKLDNTDPYIF